MERFPCRVRTFPLKPGSSPMSVYAQRPWLAQYQAGVPSGIRTAAATVSATMPTIFTARWREGVNPGASFGMPLMK